MKIALPQKVKMILDQLEAHGYEGYAVGGCVRDSLMGREPSDWDITTCASPASVKKLFPPYRGYGNRPRDGDCADGKRRL